MSDTIKPKMRLLPDTSARACVFGKYPRSSTTFRAMTLMSCARQATLTRLALRNRELPSEENRKVAVLEFRDRMLIKHPRIFRYKPAHLSLALLLCTVYLFDHPVLRAQERGDSLPANIDIRADQVEGQISPQLYGQFDEFMFEGVKRGLTAELIRDRGFDEAPNAIGLPRDWAREPDDRNDDPGLHFGWDDTIYYIVHHDFVPAHAEHSLRVELSAEDGQRRGIHESGVPIRRGVPYRGYLWIKTDGFTARVDVALEADRTGGGSYASADVKDVSGDWKKYEFTLTPSKSDALAKFVVLFQGKGRLWVDQVSLLPGDAVDGVRADVFEKIKALRPMFIRWPGGNVAQDYHWMWGIGPRDQRFTWTNLSWGNELEPSDFGTDEFVRLCRNVGAEPSLTVNVEGRGATVDEAAAWVEYANGSSSSRHGAMRAANGNSDPFKVKYWEIGNEIWGDWVRGHSDANTYAANYKRYAAAMSGVDPSIRLIAVGDNNMEWNRTLLGAAGSQIDYLAIHHYYGAAEMSGDPSNLMAHTLSYERFYKQVAEVMHELVPGRTIKLAINEWNTALPLPRQHSMESALYAARLMNVFERSDIVAMSAVSDMVNGWSGGVIQASRGEVFLTPTYLVNELYNRRRGAKRLAAGVSSPTFDTSKEGKAVPYLDVVVSRSGDGQNIFVKAVNTNPERSLRTSVHIGGATVAPSAVMETINGRSMSAANSFGTPNAISTHARTIKTGSEFVVVFPEHSISVITLKVLRSRTKSD
jgi:alpha-L-arabinofuranosidase